MIDHSFECFKMKWKKARTAKMFVWDQYDNIKNWHKILYTWHHNAVTRLSAPGILLLLERWHKWKIINAPKTKPNQIRHYRYLSCVPKTIKTSFIDVWSEQFS